MGDYLKSSAVIEGYYRYELRRVWDESLPSLGVVMLNPSTADAIEDDPTIRRCVGFAKREQCGGIIVTNLYAFRTPSPKELFFPGGTSTYIKAGLHDIVGPSNDLYISTLPWESEKVLCAWGADKNIELRRTEHVLNLIPNAYCLGTTKEGHPRHPLYVKGDQPFVPFRWKIEND